MNNWRWDNPCALGDQVDPSNPQTTTLVKVKHTSERCSWYGSDDLRAKIEPPSYRQYKHGDLLAVRPLNWDDIIDKDDDDENWAERGAPDGGRSHPSDGNDNDDSKGEEDKPGGEKGTGKKMGTNDGKGKEKGRGRQWRKGRGRETVK
ncbi:hypothetical protein BDD12DRAFT_810524 [Trichophaea hybrida]|nr:hypothetical protein BDD12DRAFT_810524 [Trichophaea hybrida]